MKNVSCFALSLLVAACGTDQGLRAGETCSAMVACPSQASRSYQACTTDGTSACRFLASDGSSFDCGSCASCAQTLLDVNDWCSGGTSAPGQHGAALAVAQAEWAPDHQTLILAATVTNLSSVNMAVQPALFTIVDAQKNVVACEVFGAGGTAPVACSGTGLLAQGGVAHCALVFSTTTPTTLVFSDGAHQAQLPIDLASIGTYVPPVPEDSEARCRDGLDNDRNGKIDCDDLAGECCNLIANCPAGTACWSLPWYASKNGSGAEHSASACSDGKDNDADGFIDCEDYDCCGLVSCGPSTACGKRGAP